MVRKTARIFTSLGLGLALAVGPVAGATTAQAATDSVTISKIGTKKAKKGKTVTVKPNVKVKGDGIRGVTKSLFVTKGSKQYADGQSSVKLKIGTYKVTQRVDYQQHVGQKKTVKKGKWLDAECTITEVIKDDVPWITIAVSCTSDEFPGTHTFNVKLEWYICDVEEYFADNCSFDAYWDDSTWWAGKTTDKKFGFDTPYDVEITPEVGETFDTYLWPAKASYTFRDDNWVDKVKTRTQTLKVKKK